MVASWFWPGLSPPGSGRTPGYMCTHTSSQALSSGLSHQRPAEGGNLPVSCRQRARVCHWKIIAAQWHRKYAVRTIMSLCSSPQCIAGVGACTRQDTSASSYKEWELTLQCWKPAGSFPWARKGWGWSTRTRQGRSGAPRRRRLCRLSNWRRSSGCVPPVSYQKGNSGSQGDIRGKAMYSSTEQSFTDKKSQGIFTSYGSVLALHQSRSICLTFLTLGAAEGDVWAVAAVGSALLRRRNKDTHRMHWTVFFSLSVSEITRDFAAFGLTHASVEAPHD